MVDHNGMPIFSEHNSGLQLVRTLNFSSGSTHDKPQILESSPYYKFSLDIEEVIHNHKYHQYSELEPTGEIIMFIETLFRIRQIERGRDYTEQDVAQDHWRLDCDLVNKLNWWPDFTGEGASADLHRAPDFYTTSNGNRLMAQVSDNMYKMLRKQETKERLRKARDHVRQSRKRTARISSNP